MRLFADEPLDLSDSEVRGRLRVRFLFPADTKCPMIRGQWERRPDGKIIASFTLAELDEIVALGSVFSGPRLF